MESISALFRGTFCIEELNMCTEPQTIDTGNL